MTLDQVYILISPHLSDRDGVKKKMTPSEAIKSGLIDPAKMPSAHGGKSLFQRIKERQELDRANGPSGLSKRERRKLRIAELRKRKAAGEL